MDNQGTSTGASWPTLTEAASMSGYTREALRLRVRRGKLRSIKGNDGVTRVDPADLADLPPLDATMPDPGRSMEPEDEQTLDDLTMTVDVLRESLDRALVDLGQVRSQLSKAQDDRLVDRGRAERAEAWLEAEKVLATSLEGRLTSMEASLVEARLPWLVRVVRAIRRP